MHGNPFLWRQPPLSACIRRHEQHSLVSQVEAGEWLHWLARTHVLILFSDVLFFLAQACQTGDHVFLEVARLTQDRAVKGWGDPGPTFDSTSALLSFCRSRAAALVSSFRAAMWRAGRRTFPFVSFSSRRDTTWSWPCCRATANGVKPSCEHKDGSRSAK